MSGGLLEGVWLPGRPESLTTTGGEPHRQGSQGTKHLALLDQADFCPFFFISDPLLPTPKITDNVARTVVLCLIRSLSCASDKNMAKKSIAAITNALHPSLKSRALCQMVQIFFFLWDKAV